MYFRIEILAKLLVEDLHVRSFDNSEFHESWYKQGRCCVVSVNRIM